MDSMLYIFVDDEDQDLKKTDLSVYAEKYLKKSGLTDDEIGKIRDRLT